MLGFGTTTRSRLGLLLGVVLVAGSCAPSSGDVTTTTGITAAIESARQRRDLYQHVVRSAQAIVRVGGYTDRGEKDAVLGTDFRIVEFDVTEVLWTAEADSVPHVAAANRIRVAESATAADSVLPHTVPESAILVLNAVDYTPGTSGQDWAVDWLVTGIVVELAGRISFLGPRADGPPPFDTAFQALWGTVDHSQVASTAARQLDLLVDFVIEADAAGAAFDDPKVPGPITTAYEELRRGNFAPARSWFELDPAVRPLNPVDTPLDVVESMASLPVFFDIRVTGHEGAYLIVRTPFGVSHVASLDAGSHPATLLGRPGDAWSITIEWINELGGAAVQGAVVEPAERDGFAGVVTIDDEIIDMLTRGGSPPLERVWRSATQEEFAALLAELAS